jgi:hypothetical protein
MVIVRRGTGQKPETPFIQKTINSALNNIRPLQFSLPQAVNLVQSMVSIFLHDNTKTLVLHIAYFDVKIFFCLQ